MINFELPHKGPDSVSPQESIALPRQLIIDDNQLTIDDHSVSLTVRIVNGCFGAMDVQYFSQQFPEYDGRKIDWIPSYQPIITLRSNHNTTKIYKVRGRLSPKV